MLLYEEQFGLAPLAGGKVRHLYAARLHLALVVAVVSPSHGGSPLFSASGGMPRRTI
jgi:hypothetical protein